ISNWNNAFAQGTEAYSWGNHADAGYLTSFTEIDPLFSSSWASMITNEDISNWNNAFAQGTEAYSWGNHADAGYLTGFTETDPMFAYSPAYTLDYEDFSAWNQAYTQGTEAYSWGNHADAGYLNSTDPYVQSLNSLTGGVNIVAGTNITVQESENNIIISSTGGGSGITFPYLANPTCNSDAFMVMNSGNGGSVAGLSSNNNVGRLGSVNYGVVGVNGTSGFLGSLGKEDAGVYAYNGLGITTKLATNIEGVRATNTTSGTDVSIACDHGVWTQSPNFNNSWTLLAGNNYNEYVGFLSQNQTNLLINGDFTNILLTDNDAVLEGDIKNNGKMRHVELGSAEVGLNTMFYIPGQQADSYVKLCLDHPLNPNQSYPLLIYKQVNPSTGYIIKAGYQEAFSISRSYLLTTTSSVFSPETGEAAIFYGNVDVVGNLSKLGGSFKIDHPQDPENKYLVHSFVESPDMMNVYNGNIVLDENGEAVIDLPDYFESLNKDFRYQLTCIGGFANIYIKEKVKNNKFKIAGGTAGLEVSWQVTGIRKDAWAEKNRIPTEVEKADKDKGKYLTPEVYNQPREKGILYREDDLQLEKK
ncbi:MAG TPA: hypothetical protein PK762_13480, partial [Candidatus Kapabacteria bacterium]|nr:hypothetical protein [Candidatus Kapabacteria bacterium]